MSDEKKCICKGDLPHPGCPVHGTQFVESMKHLREKISEDTDSFKIPSKAFRDAPPEREAHAVGVCIVCKGVVREVLVKHATMHDPHGVIGPGYRPLRPAYIEVDGYACDDCGLRYIRAPKK